jgi:hypothetical protein
MKIKITENQDGKRIHLFKKKFQVNSIHTSLSLKIIIKFVNHEILYVICMKIID